VLAALFPVLELFATFGDLSPSSSM